MNVIRVTLEINGTVQTIDTQPNRTLLEVLREDFNLTGAKDGCHEGECGACTVLFDGKPVNSCLTMIGQADGHSILTIEGLANHGELHPVQRAFVESGAVQCGFCTPGAVLSSVALLERNPDPSEEEIRTALSGNLCRCTGYTKIVEAVQAVQAAVRMVQNG